MGEAVCPAAATGCGPGAGAKSDEYAPDQARRGHCRRGRWARCSSRPGDVAGQDPGRFLGLRGLTDLRGRRLDPAQPRPSAYTEGLWGFLLVELPGGCTRLVISGYQTLRPRWLERFANYWLYIPVVWPMQARMLAVLKRNIERAAWHERKRSPPERPPSLDTGEAHQVAPERGGKPSAP